MKVKCDFNAALHKVGFSSFNSPINFHKYVFVNVLLEKQTTIAFDSFCPTPPGKKDIAHGQKESTLEPKK